uniref:Uncharacterized protein n=1 Tax=Anopheles dirus TaxID=7168 RepID=A0A182NX15_9DIPT
MTPPRHDRPLTGLLLNAKGHKILALPVSFFRLSHGKNQSFKK